MNLLGFYVGSSSDNRNNFTSSSPFGGHFCLFVLSDCSDSSPV